MGRGSYFRLATPDSARQKALADYLWSTWQDQRRGRLPQVVIYEESGPRGETFAKGAADRFREAWLQHTTVAPAVVPLANTSSDADLEDSLNKLTFVPDIIIYAGTGSVGPRLYRATAKLELSDTIFAGPGNLENRDYARYIDQSRGGRLYVADFAAISSSDARGTSVVRALQPPVMFSALAYDATQICLRAIQSVLHDQEHAVLGGFSLRTRLALAARPLDIGVEGSFRQGVVSKVNWLNTGRDGAIEYHGLTGTYSFNDHDADGAAGVTIVTYDPDARTWNPVKAKAS
jgi:ABC-type branched-subunit amino acid transport system substrate-binding protein